MDLLRLLEVDEMDDETDKVNERYLRRKLLPTGLYDPLKPDVFMSNQEKERSLIRWLNRANLTPVEDKTLLEIGCGSGSNLRQLIGMGFRPENLLGNELLPDRVAVARKMLPADVKIILGDATKLDLPAASFDVVYQSTVFSSILDSKFQEKLAACMWKWVKPGGGVLWYDFVYNNPNNPDVRGVSLSHLKTLFPSAEILTWRVTLAPPISRRVCKFHEMTYHLFNAIPLFRTHILCWIRKPK